MKITRLTDLPIRREVLKLILESIDISDTEYEMAEKRYHDLGRFLSNNAECSGYEPHVFPQGSFRLGTVIRPISGKEKFDLDLACKLASGVTRDTWTQRQLKELVGRDVDRYRNARGIQTPIYEKPRCWSILYKGHPRFHMDIVPCIPQLANEVKILQRQLTDFGIHDQLATDIAAHSVSITDNQLPQYNQIILEWPESNPQGFALWFEARMRLAGNILERRRLEARAATIDDLPAWRWKTPLQRAIQLLKRHRDIMFQERPERKPISIIITTLAARAYQGETDLSAALGGILDRMESFIHDHKPRVPNPTNPEGEDFADKWDTEKGRRLDLEKNFRNWVRLARRDFALLGNVELDTLHDVAKDRFSADLGYDRLMNIPGVSKQPYKPPEVNIGTPARPWCRQANG